MGNFLGEKNIYILIQIISVIILFTSPIPIPYSNIIVGVLLFLWAGKKYREVGKNGEK